MENRRNSERFTTQYQAKSSVLMTILLEPPKPDSPTFEVDHQIAVALATLHKSFIRIRGAGRFGNQSATILLERDGDADTLRRPLRGRAPRGCSQPPQMHKRT